MLTSKTKTTIVDVIFSVVLVSGSHHLKQFIDTHGTFIMKIHCKINVTLHHLSWQLNYN